ncbi:ribosome small subunit-dependent GTPase A [Spirochaeta africana]|uniref:Small ribosomal subunit biogenesis GTPase RsgA n=1 Tax=Spirochaeta africana (strain ATCC 700263 / DSM 8902 / Z-7692) TaxID=889378 RepID=H9UL08_SPIAZ|nr:ribosome small subunit-dependent GTPase A [Spirochaeta africana]AFG38201.1 ribosome small subunit-dependent GTPase A [Spirochaeta africana DSM 8902]
MNSTRNNLRLWGWSAHEESNWPQVPPGSVPARVTARYQSCWRIMLPEGPGEQTAEIAGAFEYLIANSEDYPAVGDWVAASPDGRIIRQVLPRRTSIRRQQTGKAARAQLLAANIDLALLVFSPDGRRNFSVGLLERFLTLTAAGGTRPVVILNKADAACADLLERICHQVAGIDPELQVLMTSTVTGQGIARLRGLIATGQTACFLGRSGVGKSSIINMLAGTSLLATAAVSRIEGKGRHTTTASQLLQLTPPTGTTGTTSGMLIDTPGLRELQLWGDETALEGSFADVAELAEDCRFRDCRHQGEPGCAVQAAAAEGFLPQQRLEHFLEQRDELTAAALRSRMGSEAYEKQKWRAVAKDQRRMRRA